MFFVYGIWSRHFARDLAPTRRDIAHLPHEIADHARLKFPHGEEARHYNGLQKLAYCFVIFVLGPLIVLTGLTMSPTMDSAFPVLLEIFGGRQSARTIHFLCAFCFFGFFHRPYRDGDPVGHLEQSALHDHRLVCHSRKRRPS